MSEHYQRATGREEPLWSFQAARTEARFLRDRAGGKCDGDTATILIRAAIMIEDLAHAADIYRFRWVSAQRDIDALRNTPRDAEKARNDEDK